MAGGGGSSNADMFNSSKHVKGTTEKKKRKRPSKKVPTTVLEANSNNFMNLVQKLTGSADEPSHHHGTSSAPKSTSPSPYPSPYSSPSNQTTPHAEDQPHQQQQSHYQQQFHHNSSSAMDDHDSGSSHNYNSYNHPAPYSYGSYSHQGDVNYGSGGGYVGYSGSSRGNVVDQDDLYQSRYNNSNEYSSSDHVGYGRAMENDISPFSWRDPMNHNSTSDYYWYHVDPAMRAS